MRNVIPFLFLIALCGCASPSRQVVVAEADQQFPPQPAPPAPMFLVWNNPNPEGWWPFMLCEIYSTTNLLESFRPRFVAPAMSTSIAFYPTNAQEFFIARFAKTNDQGFPTEYSEWSSRQ